MEGRKQHAFSWVDKLTGYPGSVADLRQAEIIQDVSSQENGQEWNNTIISGLSAAIPNDSHSVEDAAGI